MRTGSPSVAFHSDQARADRRFWAFTGPTSGNLAVVLDNKVQEVASYQGADSRYGRDRGTL